LRHFSSHYFELYRATILLLQHLVEADLTKNALTEAHRLANDMVLSLESHISQTSAHTNSCFDDIQLDLKALEDHIDSSDFVPRAALQSALDSTVQDYATMSQMDAMLLRMDRLERTTETLKEKLKQPSTSTRHEKNVNVDATSIPPSPHPANHDLDAPTNAPSDHDSTDDVIPYMTTVTVRIGNITHYHCQVLECIKRGDGTFYRVLNNVGSDFIVQMTNIVDLDQSTAFSPHSSYVNRSHRPPRNSSYGGRGRAPPS